MKLCIGGEIGSGGVEFLPIVMNSGFGEAQLYPRRNQKAPNTIQNIEDPRSKTNMSLTVAPPCSSLPMQVNFFASSVREF
jgi:hypothetical protein